MQEKIGELGVAGFSIVLKKLAQFLEHIHNNEPVKALKVLEEFEHRDLTELGAIAGYLAEEGGLFKVLSGKLREHFSGYFYAKSPEDIRALVDKFYTNEKFVELVGGVLIGCILALDEEPEIPQILH